jgi:hypothetical protein
MDFRSTTDSKQVLDDISIDAISSLHVGPSCIFGGQSVQHGADMVPLRGARRLLHSDVT